MLILKPWNHIENKYYFYSTYPLKNTISWRKIRDIVCINKWCERFCKEYDAKFLVYTEGDEILANVKLVFDEVDYIHYTFSYNLEVDRILKLHEQPVINIYPWIVINNKHIFMIPEEYNDIEIGIDYIFENHNLFPSCSFQLNIHLKGLSAEYLYREYGRILDQDINDDLMRGRYKSNYIELSRNERSLIGLNYNCLDIPSDRPEYFKYEDNFLCYYPADKDMFIDYRLYNEYSLIKTELSDIITKYFHGFILIDNMNDDLKFSCYKFVYDNNFMFANLFNDKEKLIEEIEKRYFINIKCRE